MHRKMREDDRTDYLRMCADFYDGPAVSHQVDPANFEMGFARALESEPYLEGYILEMEGKTAGYALIFKSYSQEAGGIFACIDELYVKPEFRGRGLGGEFLRCMLSRMKTGEWKRIRLEVTQENKGAAKLYESAGFQWLDYRQMCVDQEGAAE